MNDECHQVIGELPRYKLDLDRNMPTVCDSTLEFTEMLGVL